MDIGKLKAIRREIEAAGLEAARTAGGMNAAGDMQAETEWRKRAAELLRWANELGAAIENP